MHRRGGGMEGCVERRKAAMECAATRDAMMGPAGGHALRYFVPLVNAWSSATCCHAPDTLR